VTRGGTVAPETPVVEMMLPVVLYSTSLVMPEA